MPDFWVTGRPRNPLNASVATFCAAGVISMHQTPPGMVRGVYGVSRGRFILLAQAATASTVFGTTTKNCVSFPAKMITHEAPWIATLNCSSILTDGTDMPIWRGASHITTAHANTVSTSPLLHSSSRHRPHRQRHAASLARHPTELDRYPNPICSQRRPPLPRLHPRPQGVR
jgi:hypothetical protein